MALIKCPECGNKISEFAYQCVFCGCPMSKVKELLKIQKSKSISIEKTEKEKNVSLFSEKITSIERRILNKFKLSILESISDLSWKESCDTCSFKAMKGSEIMLLCWFSKNADNDMVLQYYEDPILKNCLKEFKLTNSNLQQILFDIKKVYHKYELYGNAEKEIEDTNNLSENNECLQERDHSDIFKTPQIYTNIISFLLNKSISGDEQILKLTTNVCEFVIKEVANKAVDNKYFTDFDDFERNKLYRRFTAVFYEHTFILKNISIDDAAVFYSYFIASTLISRIRSYEQIFRYRIIENENDLINSLGKMIINKNVEFSNVRGLNSNFKYVPESILVETLERLYSFTEM